MFHGPRTVADTRDYLARMLASQREAGLTRVATLERHKHAVGRWWTSYLYERKS